MIDFHSHILPGIDDGSRSVEQSLEMLRISAAQQVGHVVLTPHFYGDRDFPEAFLQRRAEAMEALRAAMDGADLPRLSLGAEVYFFRGMSQSAALEDLAIQGTDCVLVEMPLGSWSDAMYRELAAIPERRGLIPIVAHIDRYINPLTAGSVSRRLAELPVLIQANAGFFLRRSTASLALRMLRRGQIHLLGSDCHNLTTRQPNLGDAAEVIRRRLGDEAISWIRENQRNVFDTEVSNEA